MNNGVRKKGGRSAAGFTLLELLIVMTLMGILTLAVVAAFVAGIDADRNFTRQSQQIDAGSSLEQHIRLLLEGARLGTSTTDQTAFFLGGITTGAGTTTTAADGPSSLNSVSSTSSASSGSADDGDNELGCGRITFVTTAFPSPLSMIDNQDDFDTQQQNNAGPQGGLAEVSLGITAQGSDSGDRTGLFERVQQPADGDSSQGGMESLLSSQIAEIGFQFWDGTQWVTSWDSTSTESGRLPAAVMVKYTLNGDNTKTVHTFTVPIPASDVTTTNPITTTTTVAGAGT